MFVLSIKTFLFGSWRAVYCIARAAQRGACGADPDFTVQRAGVGGALAPGYRPPQGTSHLGADGKGSIQLRTAACKRVEVSAPPVSSQT